MSSFVARSAIAFMYNFSPSVVPGLIPAEKGSSTYAVMFRDLLRVLEEIDVFFNCIVIPETEIVYIIV